MFPNSPYYYLEHVFSFLTAGLAEHTAEYFSMKVLLNAWIYIGKLPEESYTANKGKRVVFGGISLTFGEFEMM
jgi:hypothetical protein